MGTVREEKLRNRSLSPRWARIDRGEQRLHTLAASPFDRCGEKGECLGRRNECFDVSSPKLVVMPSFEGKRSRSIMNGERGVYMDHSTIDTRGFNRKVQTQRSLVNEDLPRRNFLSVKFQWNHLLGEKGVDPSDRKAGSPNLNNHLCSSHGGGGVAEGTRMSAEREYQGNRYSDLRMNINGAVANLVSMENERARERGPSSYNPDVLIGRDYSVQRNENLQSPIARSNGGANVHDHEELAIRETLRVYESRKMELNRNSDNQAMFNKDISHHPILLLSHPQLQGHDYASGSVGVTKNSFPATFRNDHHANPDGVRTSPGMVREPMACDGYTHVAGSFERSELQVEDEIEDSYPYQVNRRGLATLTDEIRGRMTNVQNCYDHQERSGARCLDPTFDRVNDGQRFHGDHIRATRVSEDHRSIPDELAMNYLDDEHEKETLRYRRVSGSSYAFAQGHESLNELETYREHEGRPHIKYHSRHEDLLERQRYEDQDDLDQVEFHRNQKYKCEAQAYRDLDDLHQTRFYGDHKELRKSPTCADHEDRQQTQGDREPKDRCEIKLDDYGDLHQTPFYENHNDVLKTQTYSYREDLHQTQAYRDRKRARETQIYDDHEDVRRKPFYGEHRNLYSTKNYDAEDLQKNSFNRDHRDLREAQFYANHRDVYEMQRLSGRKDLHETQTNADYGYLHEKQKYRDHRDHQVRIRADIYGDNKDMRETTKYRGRQSFRVEDDLGTGGSDSLWSDDGHLSTSGLKLSQSMLKRKCSADMKISKLNSIGQLVGYGNIPHNIYDPVSRYEQLKVEDIDHVRLPNHLRDYQARKEVSPSREMASHKTYESNDWLSKGNLPTSLRARLSKAVVSSGIDIKKGLKSSPKNSLSTSLGKKQSILRENGKDDTQCNPTEAADTFAKINVSEDSEDFKLLVNNSFLKYVKQLYENPAEGRRYTEQGKDGKFKCSICNSAYVFMNTTSLAMHAFNSLKVGLRSQHLGFHKALCLLLGWDCTMSPNSSKTSLVLPKDKAMALKEDLVLWPPVVIIHNILVGNKDPAKRVALTIEDIETILRDMGFSGERIKVCRGKPANNSIMVVKFKGTFSGLQEAEKLHKLYADTKHGRLESQQISSDSDNKHRFQENSTAENAKHVLYGYLGIVGDLDQLDLETKKRSLVKSKKEIEAVVGAAL